MSISKKPHNKKTEPQRATRARPTLAKLNLSERSELGARDSELAEEELTLAKQNLAKQSLRSVATGPSRRSAPKLCAKVGEGAEPREAEPQRTK